MPRTLKPILLPFLLAVFALTNSLHAQNPNLLDNSSLENYVNCPNGLSDIAEAYWNWPPFHSGSTDYFNQCAVVWSCDVPTNVFGTANAFSGVAYSGGYLGLGSSNYREYLFDTLTQVLQAGQNYVITFKYRLAPNSRYTSDNLGFYLSAAPPTGTGTGPLGVAATSQMTPGNYINTNAQWLTYSDTIVATGGEQYITIGSFNLNNTTQLFNQSASIGGAYAYYDTVEVYLAQGIGGDTLICQGDPGQVYCFEMDSIFWVESTNPGNIIGTGDTINVNPNQTTTYWCIDTAANDTLDWTIIVEEPLYGFLGQDVVTCEYDPVTKALNLPGYDILWSDNETDNILVTGDSGLHWAEVTINGCSSYDTFHLDYEEVPEFDLPDSMLYCQGDTLSISTGFDPQGLSFQWNNGSNDSILKVSGGSQGLFWVEIDGFNCLLRDSVYVRMYPPINLELGNDVERCEGDTFEIVPNVNRPHYTYSWNTGSTSRELTVDKSGVYTVTISNGNCQESDKRRVFFYEYPEPTLGNDTVICQEEEMKFDATFDWESAMYRWFDGTTSPVNTTYIDESQVIWVQLTNHVCSTIDSLDITLAIPPFVRVPEDTLLCEDGIMNVEAATTAEVSYAWSNGQYSQVMTTDVPGKYTVTVDDGTCKTIDTVDVLAFETPDIDIVAPDYICIGETEVLNASHENATYYKWEDGSSQPTLNIYEPGFYSVEVFHDCGVSMDTVLVEDCECIVRFPTGFKPTPSGVNKTFGLVSQCQFISYELSIYNRWGELMFNTSDQSEQWDGTYKGNPVPPGAYVYFCEYKALYDGAQFQNKLNGTVTVLR